MKKLTIFVLAVFVIVSLSACAGSKKNVEQDLDRPINCATAEADIRLLKSEKDHVAKQIAMGVTAIVPAGAVIGVVTGKEGEKLKVATGEYWYGTRALELGLVDEIGASDDYLMRAILKEDAQVFGVTYKGKEGLLHKLQGTFAAALESLGFNGTLR